MDKLNALRAKMKAQNIDAFIVTTSDAHGSSWTAGHWGGTTWLSGFTGSAATIVVTHAEAGLWTDGRYFIQAEQQLAGTGFTLYKMGQPNVPTYQDFIKDKFPSGGVVGFDGRTMSFENYNKLTEKLTDKFTYNLADLLGEIWEGRPPLSAAPAFEHLPKFAGLSAADKLAKVRDKMKESNIATYLVTGLEDAAWLLNIRGRDLPGTPVVYAFLLITMETATVYIDSTKVEDFAGKLTSQGFTIAGYEEAEGAVKAISGGKILFNRMRTNTSLAQAIPAEAEHDKESADIITDLKSQKSEIELANIRNAFIKEGAAMVRVIKWIHDNLASGKFFTEDDVATTLTGFRKQMPDYICDSFPAIVGYAGNGAQAHYHHTGTGDTVKADGFLLLDTGGQYMDGTTDTTRTMAVGPLTDEMRRDFTAVLKGHIALNRAVFPPATTGHQLDMLARQPILATLQNYNHGTGHGIGYCLGVHEGPQGVAHRHSPVSLLLGMVISNEPAIYKEGQYGIRTENALAVTELATNENGTFYHFENLTFCPYDVRAIEPSMLSQDEKEYINAYHVQVQEKLQPWLLNDEMAWLKEYCAVI